MTSGMVQIGAFSFYSDSPLGATLGYNQAHGTDIHFFQDLIAYGGTRVRLNIKPDLYVATSMSASPSTWTWAFVDQVVTMANQNNIRVTLLARGLQPSLSYPSWQEPSSCASGFDQTTIAGYTKIAVALARRYSGDGNPDNAHEVDVKTGNPIAGGKTLQADCIELGNEEINSMQDSSSLPYTGCRKAMRYVKLVRDVLTQLRAPSSSGGGGWVPRGNFQARVGAWGIVHDQPNEITSTYGILTHPVLDATYNPSANSSSIFGFDSVLGVQLLDYANFHNYNEPDGSGGLTPAAECKQIRGILDGVGNTNIPIWCTESGRNGPCFADTVKLQNGTIENEETAQANYYAANDDGSGGGGLQALKDAGCQHWDIFTLNYWGGSSNGKYVGQVMSVATLTTSSGSPPNSYVRFKAHTRISNFMTQQDKGAWAAFAVPAGFGGSSSPPPPPPPGPPPPPPPGTLTTVATDSFANRTLASTWGLASDGTDTWVSTAESGSPTYAVSTSTFGQISGAAGAIGVQLLGTQTLTDCDAVVRVKVTATGDNAGVLLRASSGGTKYYRCSLVNHILECAYFDGTTQNDLYQSGTLAYKVGVNYWIRFRVVGSTLMGRYWADGTTEPSDFTNASYAFGGSGTITDTNLTSGKFGLRGRPAGTSNIINFDSLTVSSVGTSSPPPPPGPPPPPPPGSSAQLTGAFSPLASQNINLTSEGVGDWAHWGLTNGTTFDHKSTGGTQVSNFTTVGNGAATQNPSALNTFTWTDGTPDTSTTATATGSRITAGASGSTGAFGAAGQAATPHVMIVALENHSYASFTSAGNAFPHINALKNTYGNCTKFYGVTHQSVGNYFALVSGSDQGVTVDYTIPSGSVIAGNTIANSLDTASIGWKHYAENLPSSGYLGADTGGYIQHHDPWVYFKPFRNASTAYQQAHIVSLDASPTFTNLATELSNGVAPPFIFIQPNNSNNGHTGTDTACDNWVNSFVTMVQASTWYTANNGIIILWCDEGHPDNTATEGIGDLGSNGKHGGQTLCVVISANNSANVLSSNLNTYGVLHAILNLYGLTSLNKDAHTINGDLTPLLVGNGTTSPPPPPPPFTLLPGEVITNNVSNYVFGTNYSAISGMSVPTPTAGMNSSVASAGLTLMRVFIDNTATDAQITGRVNAIIATGCTPLVCLYSATSSTFNQHVVTLLGSSCLIYEFGNEPDGTVAPIASATFNSAWATQIPLLRAINPSAAFLSPGFNNGASSYLTSWLNSCVSSGVLPDGVGFHLYACGSIGTSAVCLTHTSDYATQINTLRTQVTSVLGVARPIGISEWNVDYHFPEVSYSHDEPFVNNYYLGVLTSMISANLDYACQFACFGTTAYHMIDENTGVITAYYTAMSQAIASLSPVSSPPPPPTSSNLGNGFTFTAPADTNPRTLNVYVDANQGVGTLAASISDGSSADYYDSSLSNKTSSSAGQYALTYAAASSGQQVKVVYTLSDGTTPGTTKSQDTFNRTNQSGLGTSSDGGTYQLVTESGSPAWSIVTKQAQLAGSSGDTSVALLSANTLQDCESAMIVSLSNLANSAGLVLRSASSATSYYRATLTGSSIVLAYVTSGVPTILNSQPASLITNTFYWLRFRIVKNSLYAKYWPFDASGNTKEPKNWNVFAIDRTIEVAGQYGFRGVIASSSDTILWDTYSIVDLSSNTDPSYVSLYAADIPTGIATASGVLSASVSTPSGTIDLTSEGTGDWAHWGYPSATAFDHKANVTQLISNYSNVGFGTYTQNTSAVLAWSWEDGLVTPTVVASTTETDVTQVGNGYSFTLPADTNSRTVYVYVSATKAQGTLTATLSDGSATAYSDSSLNDVGTGSVARYAITYNAASANQTLTIQWVMLTDNGGSGANTPLVIYGSNVAATTITTADKFATTTGGTEAHNVTHAPASGANLYLEICSQGGTPGATSSLPAPTGNGWLYDSTALEGKTIPVGNWSAQSTLSDANTGATSWTSPAVVIRFWKRNGSTYTAIGSIALINQSIPLKSVKKLFSFPNTNIAAAAFGTGDKLYIDHFVESGTGTANAWSGDPISCYVSNSATQGVANDFVITTPGFVVTSGGTPGTIGLDAASVPLIVVQGPPPPPPPPPSVNATFTVNANNAITPQTWIGLGVQQDAYTQGTGAAITITSDQRTLINERLNYMNPSLIRTCADAVSWWCPSGVVGTYDFYNATMLEWYQVFENAQQNNINVIVGVNSPAPFTALSTDWATAFAALIDQLVNNSGYTCVKYVSGLSEPDTM